MILTCPNCGTQYVVKDDAIPPEGRQVRCASCKHSWHQDPDSAAEAEPATEAIAEPQPEPEPESEPVAEEHDESPAEATVIEPRSGPEIEERAYEEAAIDDVAAAAPQETVETPAEPAASPYANARFDITKPGSTEEPAAAEAAAEDWNAPPEPEAAGDEFSPYPAADEEAPRRRRPIIAIVIVVVVIAALAVAFWFLAPPELKARLGLGAAGASPLALVTTHMDRQKLESGNELLTVTGRVINPTSKEQVVPPLQAQLRSRAGQVVYSWTIDPPARSLPPGGSQSFNSAEVNVPPGGDELTITLGASKA